MSIFIIPFCLISGCPAGAPGEVNVSADQIEKLMAERRAAERAEVEKNEPPIDEDILNYDDLDDLDAFV